jgi:predicted GNAT family N-acyltransferase
MFQIKEISAEETYAIRLEMLRKGIDLPVEFSGDFDESTFHLGAFENDVLIGIASFMKTNNSSFSEEQYQLRGMAILLIVRGKGYGKAMLHEAFEELKRKKIPILWCNARVVALDFYQKLGFEIIGEPFDISQIGTHYKMYKRIN